MIVNTIKNVSYFNKTTPLNISKKQKKVMGDLAQTYSNIKTLTSKSEKSIELGTEILLAYTSSQALQLLLKSGKEALQKKEAPTITEKLNTASNREEFTTIRDEISALQPSSQKTQFVIDYLNKYNAFVQDSTFTANTKMQLDSDTLEENIEYYLKKLPENSKNGIKTAIFCIEEDSIEFKKMLADLLKYATEQDAQMLQPEDTDIESFLYSLMAFENKENICSIISGCINKNMSIDKIQDFIDYLDKSFTYSAKETNNFINRFSKYGDDIISFIDKTNIKDLTTNNYNKDFEKTFAFITLIDEKYIPYLINNQSFAERISKWGIIPNDENIMRALINEYENSLFLPQEVTEAIGMYKISSSIQEISPETETILSDLLSTQNTENEMTLYRGENYEFANSIKTGDTTLGQILKDNVKSSKEDLAHLVTQLSNTIPKSNRFISTSLDSNIAEGFSSDILWTLKLPQGSKAAIVDIMSSQLPLEAEVLVQKNSGYLITNLEYVNEKWHIEAIITQN